MFKSITIAALFLFGLAARNAEAFCSLSWSYFDARSNGPALVRCFGAGETLTIWQQLDGNGQLVWAHSTPAVGFDQSRLLSTFDWDSLDPQAFKTEHVLADKYIFVELLDSNQTLVVGTNDFPAARNLGEGMNIVVGGNAAPATTTALVWNKTSGTSDSYQVGGAHSAWATRLFQINSGKDTITSGATFNGSFNSLPMKCPTCRDFDGALTVIAGPGGDQFFADARVGATNLFGGVGDDTFTVFGVDHLGSLMVDAGSGGANAAYLGRFNSMFGIQGPILFDGHACNSALYVTMQASADAVSRQVGLVARPGSGLVSGLAPADVSFHCDTILGSFPSWLELHAGPKSDIFTIDGLFAPETHIEGTGGADSVDFTLRHDGTIAGALYVANAGGSVGVTIDDQAGTIPTDVEVRKDYAYLSDHATHARTAWVIWNTPGATDVESVTLQLGKAANTVDIFGISDDVNYFVRGGDGGTTVNIVGEKIGQSSSLALSGGVARDVFTMTPATTASGLISIDGGGQPAGCGPQASPCGDVLNYLGPAAGAVPTEGVLTPPGGSANAVFFASIESFDAIFSACFDDASCTP